MLNHVNNMNHDAAHLMIQALSMTDKGSKLIKALEDVRYYHRHAEVYDLGYNGILVEAFDEDTDGDRYWEGSVLIPSLPVGKSAVSEGLCFQCLNPLTTGARGNRSRLDRPRQLHPEECHQR